MREQAEARIAEQERFFAFTRNLDRAPYGEAHKFDYLIEYFVDEITGPYDQDISFLLVGNKGRGKSTAGLSIAFYGACELAERLGGKWTDYFNPDTNMAVILEDEANKVMAIEEKYQIKNYDDIGIGWGARDWNSTDNKEKNDVFQINRTDSTLQLFTVPNQFLLDKVPRSLVSHYGEMAQQFFAHGFTTVKIFEPETLFREGKIIQPYLNIERTKYVLFRIPKAPDDLLAYYKKRRAQNKSIATGRRLGNKGDELAQKPKREHPAVIQMRQEMALYSKQIMDVINAGGQDQDLIEMLMKEGGFDRTKSKRWIKSKAFKEMFPK